MASLLVFFLNGEKVVIEDPDPRQTLLEYLRRDVQLRGTKLGCGEGACGACTVMQSKYSKTNKNSVSHSSIVSCLTPLCSVYGTAITTVEGVGSSKTKIHPIQKVLAQGNGTQCGYCAPGMVMSMYSLINSNPNAAVEDIENALQGNLCRCTGYKPILYSFEKFLKCNKICPEDIEVYNKQAKEAYEQSSREDIRFSKNGITWAYPTTLQELQQLKASHLNARIVAGNTQVGLKTKFENEKYPLLISTHGIEELEKIVLCNEGMEVGANVNLSVLEYEIKNILKKEPESKLQVFSAILHRLENFTGRQVKNMSTIGGTICAAIPTSDLNPVFLATSCVVKILLSGFFRSIIDGTIHFYKMDEFFFPKYLPNMTSGEIIISIIIPYSKRNEFVQSYKQTRRQALVNSCMKVTVKDYTDIIDEIRLAFGGLRSSTALAVNTMRKLQGMKWNDQMVSKAKELLVNEFQLEDNTPTKFSYKKALVTGFFLKFYVSVSKKLQQVLNVSKINRKYESISLRLDKTNFNHSPSSSDEWMLALRNLYEDGEKDKLAVGYPIPHKSSQDHTTGEAIYCDDIPSLKNELHLAFVTSTRPHAKLVSVDASEAVSMKGVHRFISCKDLSDDKNTYGFLKQDELIFAKDKVTTTGQVIGAIVADNKTIAQDACKLVKVKYEDLQPVILNIKDAIKHNSMFDCCASIKEGDINKGFSASDHILEGELQLGGQKHFYMEPQAAVVIPVGEQNEMEVYATTQDLNGVQMGISNMLGIPSNRITTKCKRIGGAFGGKGTRGNSFFFATALAAKLLNKPVRFSLDRREDMTMVGGRHPFYVKYKVGVSKSGKVQSLLVELFSDAGHTMDLSSLVMEIALTAVDNCYKIPNVHFIGKCCQTNLPSRTACRGFGALQGFTVAENIMDHVATALQLDPVKIREINMYREGDFTPYEQQLIGCNVRKCWEYCIKESNFYKRKELVDEFNRNNRWRKRGIYMVPVQFGVGIAYPFMNQGAALLHVYTDGMVLIAHGGIEMGQGLHTKMLQIVSTALGISIDKVHLKETSTDKVPNSFPSSGSSGSDIYGGAVLDCCRILLERLEPIKKSMPQGTWEEWIKAAYFNRINLSVTGYYKTPDISYDPETGKGHRFNYFTYGASCTEVEIDCLTGDNKIIRADMVMDAGKSLNPAIDAGQIQGSYMQAYGYYTMEQVVFSHDGTLMYQGPLTYKIPSIKDLPEEFKVDFLEDVSNPRAVYSSKAVSEPPMLLAGSVFFAIKNAIRSCREDAGIRDKIFQLNVPATAETICLLCSGK